MNTNTDHAAGESYLLVLIAVGVCTAAVAWGIEPLLRMI